MVCSLLCWLNNIWDKNPALPRIRNLSPFLTLDKSLWRQCKTTCYVSSYIWASEMKKTCPFWVRRLKPSVQAWNKLSDTNLDEERFRCVTMRVPSSSYLHLLHRINFIYLLCEGNFKRKLLIASLLSIKIQHLSRRNLSIQKKCIHQMKENLYISSNWKKRRKHMEKCSLDCSDHPRPWDAQAVCTYM